MALTMPLLVSLFITMVFWAGPGDGVNMYNSASDGGEARVRSSVSDPKSVSESEKSGSLGQKSLKM